MLPHSTSLEARPVWRHLPSRGCTGRGAVQSRSKRRARRAPACSVEGRDTSSAPRNTNGAAPEATQLQEALPVVEAASGNGSNAVQALSGRSLAELALLISPFFFWGTSMVAMKELAPHTTPLFVAAVRQIPAGLALVAWGARQGRPQPIGWEAWLPIAVFAVIDGSMFQGFLVEGLARTSAGLGSVIIDSQPLTVAVLASIFFGERLRALGVAGLFTGVAGLCLLEVPPAVLLRLPEALAAWAQGAGAEQAVSAVAEAAPRGSVWDSGEFWMLLAAQSQAVGTVLVPWVSRRADPIMATGYHLLLGGFPVLWLALQGENAGILADRLSQLTGGDVMLLTYVSILGSAVSYSLFFYNASKGNLTALSSLTFLTPMFAAAAGYLVLGEKLTPLQLTGALVTIAAVLMINTKGGEKEAA